MSVAASFAKGCNASCAGWGRAAPNSRVDSVSMFAAPISIRVPLRVFAPSAIPKFQRANTKLLPSHAPATSGYPLGAAQPNKGCPMPRKAAEMGLPPSVCAPVARNAPTISSKGRLSFCPADCLNSALCKIAPSVARRSPSLLANACAPS